MFSLVDTRLGTLERGKWPMVEVIDAERLRERQRNPRACQDRRGEGANASCGPYEWTVPMSLLNESVDAATGLRRAWQRFEERTWWRAHTALNMETAVPLHCWAGLGAGNLLTTRSTVRTTIDPRDIAPQLVGRIRTSTPDNALHLDDYTVLPQVPPRDFCDDLPWQPRVMYVPGGCTYVLGTRVFCLQGRDAVTGPGAAPLSFDMNEARKRVTDALRHAGRVYYPWYQADALAELTPPRRKALFMLPWASHAPGAGALVTPVMNDDVSLTQYHDLARRAGEALGGVYRTLSAPYYFQVAGRSRALDALAQAGRADLARGAPGAWKFEEFKRELGPGHPASYDRFGYATWFQVWNQLDATVLPEPAGARALRTLTYWAGAIDTYVDLGGVRTVPVPTGVLVPPYHLPFVNYRVHFTWVSVPEGYGIPRVQGSPAFDYGPLVR
ncbi:hypothetical protein [Deinococcus pimensis]|uniref:hypothetical protein n=1 Tax=Deinococcus pimensis TaxID=309888 RepID=UPI0012F82B20|nr:hypothetical protein [Deinococcus pimensis]